MSAAKQKPFASQKLDFSFKRNFANENCKHITIYALNSFLSEKLQSPITDITLINPVIAPKIAEIRGAVFDIHCTDEQGNRFIVEMQLARQMYFMQRIILYLSQAIVSIAEKGGEYNFNLPKFYNLSFLDFIPEDIGNDKDCVQYISLANDKHPEIRYPYINIAFAILPLFTKSEDECETILDWWLFSLKNMQDLEDMPERLKKLSLKAFNDLYDNAKIAKFTKEELFAYEANMKYWNDSAAILDCAKKDGLKEGEAIGMEKGEAKARNELFALLESGVSLAEAKKMFSSSV